MSAHLLNDLTQDLGFGAPGLDFSAWPQQSPDFMNLKPVETLNILDDPLKLYSKAGMAKKAKTNFAAMDDDDEKAELKKQMNKVAADRYRRKKREQFEGLRSQVDDLTESNRLLSNKCNVLETQVAYLKQLLMSTVSSGRDGAIRKGIRDAVGSDSSSSSLKGDTTKSQAPLSRENFDLNVFAKQFLAHRAEQTEGRLQRLEAQVAQLSEELGE